MVKNSSAIATAAGIVKVPSSFGKAQPATARATPNIATAITACMTSTHHRLVRNTSTNGLHSGFSTHGKVMRLVKSAISPLGMPNCAKSVILTLVTRK